MRSIAKRTEALRALSPELLRAVSDGRARVTRSGRIVSTAPHSRVRDDQRLTDNPNRGKRHAGRLPEAPPTHADQPYAPLTVSWPTTNRRGHRNPRMTGNLGRGRIGYTV